jgi:hypothetical protein
MEKNEYHLIIDINGDIDDGGVSSGSNNEVDKQQKAMQRLVRYQVAQPFIQSTKQIILNNVNTYYGSSELSQRIQVGLDTAHSLYSSAKYGVALASSLGLSAVAGGAIGVALMVGHKMLDIAVKQNEINNKTMLENEQLQILRGRAGIQFNRSRMGE